MVTRAPQGTTVEGQFPYRAPLQLKRCKLLYSQGVGMAAGAEFGIWFGMLSHAPYQARAFTRRMRGVRPGRDRQLSTLLRGFGGRLEWIERRGGIRDVVLERFDQSGVESHW
jgi:hypothetical protein